jgi:hypothetical protein
VTINHRMKDEETGAVNPFAARLSELEIEYAAALEVKDIVAGIAANQKFFDALRSSIKNAEALKGTALEKSRGEAIIVRVPLGAASDVVKLLDRILVVLNRKKDLLL